MRVLLDECINQKLRNLCPDTIVIRRGYAGFGGSKNGELLAKAEAAGFKVLLTIRALSVSKV